VTDVDDDSDIDLQQKCWTKLLLLAQIKGAPLTRRMFADTRPCFRSHIVHPTDTLSFSKPPPTVERSSVGHEQSVVFAGAT